MYEIDELLKNNESFVSSFRYADLPAHPSRRLAIVTCMDARIDVHRILGLEIGEAHVIRNAGGVVTDDVIRSLMISQLLLGTEEIAIIQHTNCGMMSFSEDELKSEIERRLGLRPHFALEAFKDLEREVKQNIARINASPFIPNKSKVRGFIYDIKSGRLYEVKY